MKRSKIKKSTADIVSQSGLALIGQAINRYTMLTQELDTQVPLRHGIKHSISRRPAEKEGEANLSVTDYGKFRAAFFYGGPINNNGWYVEIE